MSITITTLAGAPLVLEMVVGTVYDFRINNSGAAQTVKMYLGAKDGADPAVSTDRDGKEAAVEGWVYVRIPENSWLQLREPTSFDVAFADFSGSNGPISVSVGAAGYIDMQAKIVVPDGARTSGLTQPAIVFEAMNS